MRFDMFRLSRSSFAVQRQIASSSTAVASVCVAALGSTSRTTAHRSRLNWQRSHSTRTIPDEPTNNAPRERYRMATLQMNDDDVEIPAVPIPPLPNPSQRYLAANLELEGFMPDHLNFVGYFAQRAAHLRKIATSERVIHLPTRTERWHVTRGPFVHDKTKDVFERKTYKRLIQAFNADKAAIDDWISYVNANLPAGVNLCVERFEWIQLEGLGESLRSQVGKEVDDALRVEEMTLGPRSGTPTTESEIDVNSGGSLERREGRPLSFEEDVRMRAEAFIRRHSTSKPAK